MIRYVCIIVFYHTDLNSEIETGWNPLFGLSFQLLPGVHSAFVKMRPMVFHLDENEFRI